MQWNHLSQIGFPVEPDPIQNEFHLQKELFSELEDLFLLNFAICTNFFQIRNKLYRCSYFLEQSSIIGFSLSGLSTCRRQEGPR